MNRTLAAVLSIAGCVALLMLFLATQHVTSFDWPLLPSVSHPATLADGNPQPPPPPLPPMPASVVVADGNPQPPLPPLPPAVSWQRWNGWSEGLT